MTNDELILRNQLEIMQALIHLIYPGGGTHTPKQVANILTEAIKDTIEELTMEQK